MLAQISDETARSFIERLPEILRAAATNPLGLVALIVLVLGIVVAVLFWKSHNDKVKLGALGLIVMSILVLSILVILDWKGGGGEVFACKVKGFVYNEDVTPAVGMQNVRLAYVASNPTNSPSLQIATTGPDGHFSFDCTQIKPEAFPIHLRATFTWLGASHSVESEDALFFAENTDVNLYISPRAVSNHYRINPAIMRIGTSQLFRKNYAVLTNLAAPARFPTNGVLAVPSNVRIDSLKRLRIHPPTP